MVRGERCFVGRGRELDGLAAAFAQAAGGRATVVLVEAPSGMGATRFVDEGLARLAAGGPGPLVLRSDALPAWRGSPYGPVRIALERVLLRRSAAELAALLGPGVDVLRPILPAAASRAGVPAAPAPREHRAERTLEALRGLVRRLSETAPVILVLEDLHETDAASRAVAAFLARTIGDRPLLLIGTYQPDALVRTHPLRGTLAAIQGAARQPIRLALPPLDRAALSTLIEAHEGERPSAPLLLLVTERSAGNPLLAEEVLAARRELSGASLTMPLERLVHARVALRSAECRRALRALAIADGPVGPADLAAIAAASDVARALPAGRAGERGRGGSVLGGGLAAGLEEAVAAGFAVTEASLEGEASRVHRIRHELIAGSIATDLLPVERRRMHVAAATALGGRPAEAEQHWLRAHEPARALDAAVAAAGLAEAVGAGGDALAHLELAIALESAVPRSPQRAADGMEPMVVRAAEAAAAAGNPSRAAAFLETAIAGHDAGDRHGVALLWERVGHHRFDAGDRDGAVAGYQHAIALLPRAARADRARMLARLAQLRLFEGAFSDAERLAEETLALAGDEPSLAAVRGHAVCTVGAAEAWQGRPDRGIELLRQALALATELGNPDDAFRARANLTTALDLEGRRAEALAVAREGIARAELDGLEALHGNLLRGNAADFLFTLGEWEEALEFGARALSWAPTGIAFVNAAVPYVTLATEMGAADGAIHVLGRLLLELEKLADSQFAVPAYRAAAALALWQGDHADARRSITIAWERIRQTEDWVLGSMAAATAMAVAMAQAEAARDRRDVAAIADARTWGSGILAEATRLLAASRADPAAIARREADAELATARAALGRVSGQDDPRAWAAVAERWTALRRPYDAARARFHESEARLAAADAGGDRREGRDDARGPLLEAAEIATRLRAVPLLRALADLAGRARIPLPAESLALLADQRPVVRAEEAVRGPELALARPGERPTAETFGLSPRERGVLAEIVAGRTNRVIGERLYISEKTVAVHVARILAKLGVSGRVEAATVALRLGLVDDLLGDAKRPGPLGPGLVQRRSRR